VNTRHGGLSLRLFVAGDSPESATAVANLRALFPPEESPHVTLEIIDVERDPARAARDGIMVTPTLLKVSPTPVCRILGNLKNGAALLSLLGVAESSRTARLVERRMRRRNDRHAARHRLHDRDPEPLEPRRVGHDGGPAVQPCELLVRDEPEPSDPGTVEQRLLAPALGPGDSE